MADLLSILPLDMVGAVAVLLPGSHTDDNAPIQSGHLVETGPTVRLFSRPRDARTEEYVTGRIG